MQDVQSCYFLIAQNKNSSKYWYLMSYFKKKIDKFVLSTKSKDSCIAFTNE